MNYRLKKVWVIIAKVSSNEHIYTFEKRGEASILFCKIVDSIKQKFPDNDVMESNVYGSQHNSYYGLLNYPIEVRLIGCPLCTYPSSEMITQYKKELIEEKIYAI